MNGSPDDLSVLFAQDGASRRVPDELVPALYSELRRLASSYLHSERRNHTLQTTALVHEAYLRLLKQRNTGWENKNQFLGIAAQLMRRILVDYARSHLASKRGGHSGKVFLEEVAIASPQPPVDVIAVDEALTKLAQTDSLQARIVELRFFGGLNVDQVAAVIGISDRTVKRNWKVAKARLARELAKGSKSA